MERLPRWTKLVGAVLLGGLLLYALGYWTSGGVTVDTSAADAQAARFDSLATTWADAHAEAIARADSLAGVVAQQDTALQAAVERNSRLAARHAEANRTLERLTDAATGADGSAGKGEFDLQAWTAAQDAFEVSDSLVAGLREQVQLQQQQLDAVKAENRVLRASMSQSDSLVAEAKKTVDAANALRSTLEDAAKREGRRAARWKGLTFAAAGGLVACAILCNR